MNLKLPENRDERNKILLIVGIVIVAICYIIYMFGISPMLKKKDNYAKKISDLNEKIWRAQKEIKRIPQLQEDNSKVIHDIIDLAENKRYVLHPNLGNYLLVASDLIHESADPLGLKINSITESPATGNKLKFAPDDPSAPYFKPYTVTVNLNCSYFDLVKLVKSIENSNPFLTIVRLSIINRTDDNLNHDISFDVQWPIWADQKQPIKLVAEQMNTKK